MIALKKHFKTIIIFLLAFFAFTLLNFVASIDLDNSWNFHFIQNIYNGYTPYNDFNIIIPPLFHYIGSFLMCIFGNKYYVMHIYGGLISAILFILSNKIIRLNIQSEIIRCILQSFLSLILVIIGLSASYNLLIIVFVLALVYVEQKSLIKNNDDIKTEILKRNTLRIIDSYQTYNWFYFFNSIFYLLFNKKSKEAKDQKTSPYCDCRSSYMSTFCNISSLHGLF